MKTTTMKDARKFEKEVRRLQRAFGLTDWTLAFGVKRANGVHEALISYDCEDRHAYLTFYIGVETDLSPERVAKHEAFHLLLADMLYLAAKRGSDEHLDVARAEHQVIERLLNAGEG